MMMQKLRLSSIQVLGVILPLREICSTHLRGIGKSFKGTRKSRSSGSLVECNGEWGTIFGICDQC